MQNNLDITNKYKKYLDKFNDFLNQKNLDITKGDLYANKIRNYGKLLHTGGNLNEQIDNTIKEVNTALDGLKNGVDTTKITTDIQTLKEKFDQLTNSYAQNVTKFIDFTNNTKKKLDNYETKPIEEIKGLNEFLANDIPIDMIIQAQIFKNIIKDIGDVSTINDTNRNKLEELATFPLDDLSRLILYLKEGNTTLGIEKNEVLANALPDAINKVSNKESGIIIGPKE